MSTDQQPRRRTKQGISEIDLPTLCDLLRGLESKSPLELRNSTSRKQDVLAMRAEIARLVKKQAGRFCTCQAITVALDPEEFQAKIDNPCPIHGRYRLGVIVTLTGYPCDGDDPRDRRIAELLREYELGCLNSRKIRRPTKNEA